MSDNSTQYSPAKLKEFKAILDAQLKKTIEELDTLKSNRKEQRQRLANSNIDYNASSKHFQEQAKDKRRIQSLQRKSRELKSALTRIDNKTYGVCDRSGKLIQEARLKAMPTARFDILRK
ncbi:hypothetical protein FGM00_07205 [Aggregatimonas sangjinii]|uniref:Zinc finger DksA/TraR C4-type domain-containing protein n=1 Tax=Aggregatimonas sangjinii TaxID=2583587 RepID=A0A5B7SN09_9FLAO|nr:TraR/DksA C4-type zinc finger protein [Aggregatimonas sangjinii]QCW99896.1 hypothetical protein FGM00_07205 [Aggregatimonas sangjinii]